MSKIKYRTVHVCIIEETANTKQQTRTIYVENPYEGDSSEGGPARVMILKNA